MWSIMKPCSEALGGIPMRRLSMMFSFVQRRQHSGRDLLGRLQRSQLLTFREIAKKREETGSDGKHNSQQHENSRIHRGPDWRAATATRSAHAHRARKQ